MIVDDELVLGTVDVLVGITEVVTFVAVVEVVDASETSLSKICPFKITDQQINSNPNLAISAAFLKYVATKGTPK